MTVNELKSYSFGFSIIVNTMVIWEFTSLNPYWEE